MRIKITIDLTDKRIPINYNSLLQGVIYNSLVRDEFVNNLHDKGYRIQNKPFKLFTFSRLFGNFKYCKETYSLLSSGQASFFVTSFYDELLIKIVKSFDSEDVIALGNTITKIIKVEVVNDLSNNSSSLSFKTISPVVINKTENGKSIYINPSDEEYINMLKNNVIKKYYLCFNENSLPFNIDILSYSNEQRIYYRNTFYKCNDLIIRITGITDRLLKVLMTCGIGSKNSMGFGMLEYEKKNISI